MSVVTDVDGTHPLRTKLGINTGTPHPSDNAETEAADADKGSNPNQTVVLELHCGAKDVKERDGENDEDGIDVGFHSELFCSRFRRTLKTPYRCSRSPHKP